MATSLLLSSLLFFVILVQTSVTTAQPQNNPIDLHLNNPSLLHQLEQATLKISQLELISEEKNRDINAVNSYIEQMEKAIVFTTLAINRLPNYVFSSTKEDLSETQENLNFLDKEVRRLWEVSRRNNFEMHYLELKARDAQDRWVATLSRVENMAAIVSEQWIQVQHFEQAVQMAKVRTLQVKTELISMKCPFLKYVTNAFCHHVEESKENLTPYLPEKRSRNFFISQASDQLSRFFTAAKYFHYQLQGMVKQALESHDFTRVLANREVVFFMASALILFPMMSALVLLWRTRK